MSKSPCRVRRFHTFERASESASCSNAVLLVAGADLRTQLAQRRRQPLEVGVRCLGGDVDVASDVWRTVRHRREPTDEHVLDAVSSKTRRGWAQARVAARASIIASRSSCIDLTHAVFDRRRFSGERSSADCATSQSLSSAGTIRTWRSNPHARSSALMCSIVGDPCPRSSRAIADCVVPDRSASSAWVRPARRRARRTRWLPRTRSAARRAICPAWWPAPRPTAAGSKPCSTSHEISPR